MDGDGAGVGAIECEQRRADQREKNADAGVMAKFVSRKARRAVGASRVVRNR